MTIVDENNTPIDPEEDNKSDIGFVPPGANADLQLTPQQGLRTTALMLAIKYQSDSIVKDAGMYQQLKMDGKVIKETDHTQVIKIAHTFEHYLTYGMFGFKEEEETGKLVINFPVLEKEPEDEEDEASQTEKAA